MQKRCQVRFWRHLRELKYTAVIAHNHNQTVITNLQYKLLKKCQFHAYIVLLKYKTVTSMRYEKEGFL